MTYDRDRKTISGLIYVKGTKALLKLKILKSGRLLIWYLKRSIKVRMQLKM